MSHCTSAFRLDTTSAFRLDFFLFFFFHKIFSLRAEHHFLQPLGWIVLQPSGCKSMYFSLQAGQPRAGWVYGSGGALPVADGRSYIVTLTTIPTPIFTLLCRVKMGNFFKFYYVFIYMSEVQTNVVTNEENS